jgi:hypothetical protein
MANYTDAILQFNPYVQQLPVELMMKVGMQKQAQYDQGVQKIQQSIDNVAGLDAPRPQDKEYLESKLGELGNRLKTVAAGDFSNQQLVNSVGGMASSLIKDPYIQSAVYSAAQIKKNSKRMAEAEEKGELAPENVDLYQKELNKYMTGKLGDQFDGKYIPYVDVMEHLRKVAKDTGVDENIIPDLFETDSNGKTVMQKNPVTGQISPKINKVMAERHLKGKTAEKLLMAFNNSLTPEVKRQLAITGIYQNKDLTPEMLAAKTSASFSGHIKQLETDIARLDMAMDVASNSQYDPEKLQVLQAARQDATDSLSKIEKQRNELTDINYVTKNADSIRANLYSTNFLQGTANQMKEVSDITEYKVNPWFDVMMKENDYNLRLKQENRQANEFNILRREHATDREEDKAKWRLDYYGKFGQFPEEIGKKSKTNIIAPIDEKDYEGLRGQFEGGYSEDVDAQNNLSQKLGLQFLKSRNPNLSDEQLMKQVEKWTGGKEESKTAMMNRFAGYLVTNYDKNPRDIPSKFHGQIEALKLLNDAVVSKGDAIRTIDEQAREQASKEGLDVKEYDKLVKSIKPLTLGLMDRGGLRSLTLTSEDVINAVKTRPQYGNVLGKFTVSDAQKVEASNAENKLIGKYGIDKYQKIMNLLYPKSVNGEGTVPLKQIADAEEILWNDTYKKISKIKGELYAKSDIIPRTIIEPVKVGTDNSEGVAGNINAVLAKYQVMPNLDASFDYETATKVANGDKSKTHFEIKQVGGKMQYTMVNTSKEGTSRAIVEPSDYTAITGKPIHVTTELDPMFLKLNTTGTTAKPNGLPWFSGRSFPLLKDTKYKTVTGNLVNDELDPSKVWFELNIPGYSKPVTYPDPIDHPEGLSKKDPIDGSLNTNLKFLSTAISVAEIESLLQKNKK